MRPFRPSYLRRAGPSRSIESRARRAPLDTLRPEEVLLWLRRGDRRLVSLRSDESCRRRLSYLSVATLSDCDESRDLRRLFLRPRCALLLSRATSPWRLSLRCARSELAERLGLRALDDADVEREVFLDDSELLLLLLLAFTSLRCCLRCCSSCSASSFSRTPALMGDRLAFEALPAEVRSRDLSALAGDAFFGYVTSIRQHLGFMPRLARVGRSAARDVSSTRSLSLLSQ